MKSLMLLTLGLAFALPLHAEETPKTEKPKHTPEEMFKKKDADGDGFITKEEFAKGSKDSAKAEGLFAKKDTDSDGKLSLAEFSAGGKEHAKGKKKAN